MYHTIYSSTYRSYLQPLDLESVSADDDEDDEGTSADFSKGQIIELGGTRFYECCPYPSCSKKGLTADKLCPKCQQQVSSDMIQKNVTMRVAISNDGQDTLYYRMFGSTIEQIFSHQKLTMPNNTEELEDTLLDLLPLQCQYVLGSCTSSNIIQQIKF